MIRKIHHSFGITTGNKTDDCTAQHARKKGKAKRLAIMLVDQTTE